MAKCELNIIPYNEVYYANCFYVCFFAAVKYLNGSILSYFANDHFTYRIEPTAEGLTLKLNLLQEIPFPEMAENNNILLDIRYDYFEDIVDRVMDTILKGNVVVLPVDGFYYKHRYHDLFFQKEHHNQIALIYGFDSEKKIFKVFEVNGFGCTTNNFCYTTEISFQNLIICHEGIINYKPNIPTLTILSNINPDKKINEDPPSCKNSLIKNMKLHRSEIIKSLQDICLLSDSIDKFDINTVEVFNNKVASMSNLYRIKSILGDEYNLESLQEDIIKNWAVIEATIIKNERRKVKDNSEFLPRLNKLFKQESMFYEELFSLFDKI